MMIKREKTEIILTIIAACLIVFTANIVIFAASAHSEAAGNAGSARVTAEVGFNGVNAYAKVSATNNIDALIDGTASSIVNGEVANYDIFGGINQSTYGQIERNCPQDVISIRCSFDVSSADGSWQNSLSAH